MSALKRISIEHLRGCVLPFTLSFESDKKLTIVYGENGTGKSTICDAFEFLSKGKVGSLDNRGLGKTTQYWPSLGKTAIDVSVTLETKSATHKARIAKNDVLVTPLENRPRAEVLRRSKILALVEATPADRYSEIRRFIDVSGVEASEDALRRLIRDLDSTRLVAVARVQENGDSLRQFWESAKKPGKDPIAWAEAQTTASAVDFDVEITAMNVLRAAYERLNEYTTVIPSARSAVDVALSALTSAQKTLDKSLQDASADAAEIIEILDHAQSYLHKHPQLQACPLCESEEKVADLAARVQQRLAAFKAVQSAQVGVRQAESNLTVAQQRLDTVMESAQGHITAFAKLADDSKWPSDVLDVSTKPPADVAMLPAWLAATSSWPEQLRKAEGDRHDKKQFLSTLKKALKTWRDHTLEQKELDGLLPRLKAALNIVEEERRKFADGILAVISQEVGRLYEAVHPGEGLNKISLELDANKRASLEFGASFCGQPARPQAYFSDSHLETLGLCVFLALAAIDQPKDTVLVLDDVLASVDEPHVERLIHMLYAEAVRFRHCLITTHYRPWKQKLRWGWLQNGQCHFVELTKWSTTDGLTLIRSLPDLEALRTLLSATPPDPQLVCSKAGVILEAALDFLTLQYECAVPRKSDNRFTLGDLLPAIDKKLRQALKVDIRTVDPAGLVTYATVSLTPIFEELIRIVQMRNVFGAHFNALSFELLDSDALGFGTQVLSLMDVLTDAESGWPRNSNSGSYWATAGETRRLHPLKKPN